MQMSMIEITPVPWFFMGRNLDLSFVQGFMYLLILDWLFEICFMTFVLSLIPWSRNLRGDVIIAVALVIFPEIVED